MAVKAWHITVMQGAKTIVKTKTFFVVGEANTYFKEMKEKYPSPTYTVYRENY